MTARIQCVRVRMPVARQSVSLHVGKLTGFSYPCRATASGVVFSMSKANLKYVIGKRTDGANPVRIFESLPSLDQSELSRRLRDMHYSEFLQTAYWFAVSSMAKSKAGMRCQICNSFNSIQVHHRTYDTFGSEFLHMNDLTVLCGHCHGMFHGHALPIPPVKPIAPIREKPPKGAKRTKVGYIVPHAQTDDVVIPDGDTFVLTKELLNQCRANGAFTNATINSLGITRETMQHGWVTRLVGTTITRARYKDALDGRFVYRQKFGTYIPNSYELAPKSFRGTILPEPESNSPFNPQRFGH